MQSICRSVFLLSAFMLLAQIAVAESAKCPDLPPGFEAYDFRDETGPHRYVVFVPKQYTPDRKWPVVLFLHGAGERGTDSRLILAGGLVTTIEKSADFPCIAVFPQCEDKTGQALKGWETGSPDARRALSILDQVERHYSVDPAKRMLAGWSMGGYGAWSLAAANPEKWSSVLVMAGGAIHDSLPLERLAERKVPVWAISAKGDPLVPYQRSQTLVDQLNQAGGNGTFTLLESDDHDVWRKVFASSEVFDWLIHPENKRPPKLDGDQTRILPRRTRYYSECLAQSQLVTNSLSVRLGNEPLAILADQLPRALSEEPMTGRLADIHRSFGMGEKAMKVSLTDLNYSCRVPRIWGRGISGGRLGLEISFEPLELSIGTIRLQSLENQATTGPTIVRIGLHEPALLKLEVQPVVHDGVLKLQLLRSEFDFDEGNWYITPPRVTEFRSSKFTQDQLVTGIIGSLYESRKDLVDGILEAIPELLKEAESRLQERDAPALARMLSPLPVLVPDLTISPSSVRTDRQGVSILFNFEVSTLGPVGPTASQFPLSLNNGMKQDRLSMDVSLDAVTAFSRLTVDQHAAQVNVLDISNDQFARFADPKFMRELLPDAEFDGESQLRTLLTLLSPMTVTGAEEDADPETSELNLQTSAAALDVYRVEQEKAPVPVGRILFALSQPLTIHLPGDREAENATIEVRWSPKCTVQFLRGERLEQSPAPSVNGERFEETFAIAWRDWGQTYGTQKIPLVVGKMGSVQVRVKSIDVQPHQLQLQFETRAPDKGASKPSSSRSR